MDAETWSEGWLSYDVRDVLRQLPLASQIPGVLAVGSKGLALYHFGSTSGEERETPARW